MKKFIVLAALAGLFLVPSGAFAVCAAPGCVPARPCGICRVDNCYRTVQNPCVSPDLGIGRVLGHIFAPRCMPKCQHCNPCP